MFQILVIFALILILHRCKISLGIALVLGGAVLDLWAGRHAEFFSDLVVALTRPETWLLVFIVALILELGRFLAEEHNAQVIMATARHVGGRHGRAVSLMTIPAAIGLVPMPGGALFSAPLVDHAVKEDSWKNEWKAAVNYWFRHVWEYWWPLYPVVILSLSIFDIPTWKYMATMVPFSLLAILSGFFFLVRPHLSELASDQHKESVPWRRAIFLSLPVIIIVVATLVLPTEVQRLAPSLSASATKMVAMILGLALGLGLIFWDERGHLGHKPFSGLLKPKSLNMLTTLAGVMIFQSLLDSSGLLPQAAEEWISTGIPIAFVIAGLPFVAGLVTGVAIGYAGPAFPLVVGFMQADGSYLTPMATLALAFGFGYAGMMMSPVHLCLVLTKDYFASSYRMIYPRIFGCVATLMVASLLAYIILTTVGW